ncbi:UNVERIFIED_CONTAM: hypothetical protein Scaly_2213400 [Sesamum calycinum]|uniref:Uncharacterized protein n=1 Tax=Sesamum calycinum TaxID=2727403 RepID=A0AAW2MNV5_9LAMI
MIPDEPEENPEEDPMEYQDDDGELTEGSIRRRALFKNESGVSVAQLRFPAVLEGYSDASWIAKSSGSNGCSEYVFTLGGGAVSWKSAKQTLITRSTFEAELCIGRLVPRQNGYLGCYRNFPFNPNHQLSSNEHFTSLIAELQQQLRDSNAEMEKLKSDISRHAYSQQWAERRAD